jgi:hypothetical protein
MRTGMVYIPHLGHSGMTKHTKGKMQGRGASVLLQSGGPGAGSSYDSVADYMSTTERNPLMKGKGALGKRLESLSLSLKPAKTKVKNIKFNL